MNTKKAVCEVCGYGIILDTHHWSKTETSYLCPNCHSIISRFLEQNQTNPEWLKQMNRFFEPDSSVDNNEDWKKNITVPEYIKIAMYDKREDMLNAVKRMRADNFEDILNKSDKKDHYADGKFNHCRNINKFRKMMDDKECCNMCHFKIVKDTHHFRKRAIDKGKKTIYLCPNHHNILHRILKDTDGTKFNSKHQIIKSIMAVEK